MKYYLYILHSRGLDRYYIGQTSLLPQERLNEHNSRRNLGSYINREYHGQYICQLNSNLENKTYLILDNLRAHHSKLVKKWELEIKDDIALFYLPSYSPEKNPDEYLNCDLKYGISEKPAPENKEQIQNNVKNHMEMLQQNSQRVIKYFKHKDLNYAA